MTPGSTTAMPSRRSISTIDFMPSVDSTMPPATGTEPPVRPVPPERGVIGTSASRATRKAVRMSSAFSASTTASGTTPIASDSSRTKRSQASGSVNTFDGPSARSNSERAWSHAEAEGRGTSGRLSSTS